MQIECCAPWNGIKLVSVSKHTFQQCSSGPKPVDQVLLLVSVLYQNLLVRPRWKCWFVLKSWSFLHLQVSYNAGLVCRFLSLGHGVLRWSDLQHSNDLTLTDDALMGITWRMKKRSVQVPWASLRIGVSGRDWAFKWLEVLSHHGLLGKDFVILAPSHDLKSFKDLVANFYHCQSMLRTLLLHSGFTASEAMTFSCHSWRHLFPKAGRQLRLSNETLNDMGHWAPNSGMPQRYDSAACVSELTGKATVRRAFQGGWSMVGPGCVPLPVASQDSSCSVVKKPKIQPDKVTNVLVPVMSGSVVSKPSTARALEHHGQRRIHLWVLGSYSLCSLWKCCSPAEPTLFAHFANEGELEFKNLKEGVLKCKKGYDSKYR